MAPCTASNVSEPATADLMTAGTPRPGLEPAARLVAADSRQGPGESPWLAAARLWAKQGACDGPDCRDARLHASRIKLVNRILGHVRRLDHPGPERAWTTQPALTRSLETAIAQFNAEVGE